MPLLTPSRIAVLVVSFSLMTFLWTFGLPQQFGEPAAAVGEHYGHGNLHTDPIIPPPVLESTRTAAPAQITHGDRPETPDDHRWDDATKKGPTATKTPGDEDGGGKWKDRPQETQGGTPTTLLTTASPAPSGLNVTNATVAATADEPAPSHVIEKFCKDVHGAPHVMVILRTSRLDIEKLNTHFLGLLSCVPNFAIFSDHSGEFNGHTVHNALESIGSEAKRTHDEFREYQLMHADQEHKPDEGKIKNLDKWKFLPMVYRAYHLKSDAKFYMFIEADTSLSWTNLLQWVNRLDYRIPYYSGAPIFMNGKQIAQRGSGILLSQGAMRRYAKSYDELYTSKWEISAGKECCGDLLLGMALADAHVEFYSSWPLLQGEQPNTLDYTKKQWCVPAVSWHHINDQELSGMWNRERKWTHTNGWEIPYLYRDAFHEYVEPHIEAKKDLWDNLSGDTKIAAPQGRQKQMQEEEERSRKHQEEEAAEKIKKVKEKEDEKKEKEKQKEAHKESLEFQNAESEEPEETSSPATRRGKREDKDKDAIDWDKLAEKFKDAGDSPDRCQKACEETADCLQWRYSKKGDGECNLGKVLRLGKKLDGDGGAEKWVSGWMVDRIKKVTEEWECKKVDWQFYQ